MKQRSADYIRLLRGFSLPVLQEAYDGVVREWKLIAWPPPGAFYTAAAKIVARDRRPAEHLPAPGPGKSMAGVPLARVEAILDEHPGLSAGMRAALRHLTISAGAGVEGEDRTRRDVPPLPKDIRGPDTGILERTGSRRFGSVIAGMEGKGQSPTPDMPESPI